MGFRYKRWTAWSALVIVLCAIASVGICRFIADPPRRPVAKTPAIVGLDYEGITFPSREDNIAPRRTRTSYWPKEVILPGRRYRHFGRRPGSDAKFGYCYCRSGAVGKGAGLHLFSCIAISLRFFSMVVPASWYGRIMKRP